MNMPLSLAPLSLATANKSQRALLEEVQAELGFVPNMYANMAHLPGLLATYLDGYNRFRQQSGLSPQEQEVVFLTISRFNGCTYCMAAHSMLADKVSGMSEVDLRALREGEPLPTAKLAALNRFTTHMLESRGRPDPGEIKAFLSAGFSEEDVLAILLAMSVKLLSNYSNHLFATRVDEGFAAYRWQP